MSTFYSSRGLKFLWKIENFSLLKGEGYFCHLIEQQKWVISITRDNSNIIAHLHNLGSSRFSICCTFSFLNHEGTPLICKEVEIERYKSFDSVKDLFVFPNETKYFPNDTLRVEFRMWLGEECGLFSPVSRFACTQMVPFVKLIEKSYICNVLQVTKSDESLSVTFSKTICSGMDLHINISLPQFGQVSIEFESTLFGFLAKIKVYILDDSRKEIEFGNHNAKFTSENSSCKFNMNISKAILLCHSEKFLPSEKLSLMFACKFFGCFNLNRIVDEREIFENRPQIDAIATADSNEQEHDTSQSSKTPDPNTHVQESSLTISQSLLDMFSEGYLSDFSLKVGERTFPVHKNILGARSRVFKLMFASEMKEMQNNCVDIKDVDGDTLERMLEFVYSDRLHKDMDWTEAWSLYTAADFYALETLKQGCSTIIKEGLCVTNALGVLALADLHQDLNLKSAALDFIFLNHHNIIGTEAWIKFEEESAKLALETFRELYSKKLKY